ncbi:hypothetical protein RM555_06425 [Micromonospora sp. DSM 115977]|uniref:Uncharacterized protein n=1 Tax=Micromonospora reichwaldensis TaxID=3075516 RepID=A0ABU2WTD4_9ACTN|nr:hypothetical protein [Micromonospora sp. DSM 115977]MDT0528626.1 hypothetical protein [Micromonospora sp. DSM 115977]
MDQFVTAVGGKHSTQPAIIPTTQPQKVDNRRSIRGLLSPLCLYLDPHRPRRRHG